MSFSLNFPEADRAELLRHHGANAAGARFTPETFVSDIARRIYTEYCCGEGRDQTHKNFQLTPHWEDFINREVFFALQRRENCIVINDDDCEKEQIYREARTAIIAAVVARAIVLFSDWGGNAWPPSMSQDKRNLRADLTPHISDPQFA